MNNVFYHNGIKGMCKLHLYHFLTLVEPPNSVITCVVICFPMSKCLHFSRYNFRHWPPEKSEWSNLFASLCLFKIWSQLFVLLLPGNHPPGALPPWVVYTHNSLTCSATGMSLFMVSQAFRHPLFPAQEAPLQRIWKSARLPRPTPLPAINALLTATGPLH